MEEKVVNFEEEEIKEFPQQTTFNTDDMSVVIDEESEEK